MSNQLKARALLDEFPFLARFVSEIDLARKGARVERWDEKFLDLVAVHGPHNSEHAIYLLSSQGEILRDIGSYSRMTSIVFGCWMIPFGLLFVAAYLWPVAIGGLCIAGIILLWMMGSSICSIASSESVRQAFDIMGDGIDRVHYGLIVPYGRDQGIRLLKPPHGFPSVADWFAHWKAKAAEEVHSQVSSA